MTFEKAYADFLNKHIRERTGEACRRLEEGHGHGERMFLEQVWWPAFGQFDDLVPEFEVHDFKDGFRYLDFAYLRPPHRICFEIDGYGPHLRDLSRWQHSDQLRRQNDLITDGWKVYRFSYDDVVGKPRSCQRTLQQIMGKWYGSIAFEAHWSPLEKETVRYMIRMKKEVKPGELMKHLQISDKTSRRLLKELAGRSVLLPASGTQRIRRYILNPHCKWPMEW